MNVLACIIFGVNSFIVVFFFGVRKVVSWEGYDEFILKSFFRFYELKELEYGDRGFVRKIIGKYDKRFFCVFDMILFKWFIVWFATMTAISGVSLGMGNSRASVEEGILAIICFYVALKINKYERNSLARKKFDYIFNSNLVYKMRKGRMLS